MAKLKEWTDLVSKEVRDAGFEVSEFEGFPLVAHPKTFEDKKRFLELQISYACERHIHKEGVLLLPNMG